MPDFKRIPTTELIWEQIAVKEGGPVLYFVTSDKRREVYKLWKKERDGLKIIGKAKDPVKLRKGMH